MRNHSVIKMVEILRATGVILSLATTLAACSESSFSGEAGNKGMRLKGPDEGDETTNCDRAVDPDCTSTNGNGDNGGPGLGNTANGSGPGGLNGTNENGDPNDPNNPNNPNGGLNGGDGENSMGLYGPLKIRADARDDSVTLTVKVKVKGAVVKTQTLDLGKGKGPWEMADMCRKGRVTCLELTFQGKVTETLGASSCTNVKQKTTTGILVHSDTSGPGLLSIGSCLNGADEEIWFECPDSKELQAENCTGI